MAVVVVVEGRGATWNGAEVLRIYVWCQHISVCWVCMFVVALMSLSPRDG